MWLEWKNSKITKRYDDDDEPTKLPKNAVVIGGNTAIAAKNAMYLAWLSLWLVLRRMLKNVSADSVAQRRVGNPSLYATQAVRSNKNPTNSRSNVRDPVRGLIYFKLGAAWVAKAKI